MAVSGDEDDVKEGPEPNLWIGLDVGVGEIDEHGGGVVIVGVLVVLKAVIGVEGIGGARIHDNIAADPIGGCRCPSAGVADVFGSGLDCIIREHCEIVVVGRPGAYEGN